MDPTLPSPLPCYGPLTCKLDRSILLSELAPATPRTAAVSELAAADEEAGAEVTAKPETCSKETPKKEAAANGAAREQLSLLAMTEFGTCPYFIRIPPAAYGFLMYSLLLILQ